MISAGKLGGIFDVVPPLSRGRQQGVKFMGSIPDVYKEGSAEIFAPVTQDVLSVGQQGLSVN